MSEDDDRLLRYVRAMADADDEDMYEWEREYGCRARAAIALSDQEAAERVEADMWGRYEALRDDLIDKARKTAVAKIGSHYQSDACAALDAFVRRHIAVAEARGAVPEGAVAWRCKTVNGLGWAYLTEHRQGVQMGPEWEPLYATTPASGLVDAGRRGRDAMNVWICDDFEGYYPVGTAAVVAAETEDEARELLDAKLKEHGLPQSGSVSIYRFSQDKPQAYIIRDGDY